MSDDANVTKGKELVLLARNDLDTLWEIVGGVKERGYTFDNPVEDTTSSSTTSDYSDSEWTGFSNVSINISGLADKRTGTSNGYNIVGASRLFELATSGNRCGKFKMVNVENNGFIEGIFNITNLGSTGSTPGLLGFDATLQSNSDIIVFGAPI
jgi:predicted secreted protein